MYIKLFGYLLAFAALLTSLAMAWMGGRWQAIEASAYGGKRRPWWFYVLSLVLVGLYLLALLDFIEAEKNLAAWLLMIIIPAGWALKSALVIFNPRGRQAVSSLQGDQNWRKVALARLPIAILLGVLAALV